MPEERDPFTRFVAKVLVAPLPVDEPARLNAADEGRGQSIQPAVRRALAKAPRLRSETILDQIYYSP